MPSHITRTSWLGIFLYLRQTPRRRSHSTTTSKLQTLRNQTLRQGLYASRHIKDLLYEDMPPPTLSLECPSIYSLRLYRMPPKKSADLIVCSERQPGPTRHALRKLRVMSGCPSRPSRPAHNNQREAAPLAKNGFGAFCYLSRRDLGEIATSQDSGYLDTRSGQHI